MLLFAVILKGLVELLLLVMVGQGLLFVLAGSARHQNLVYRMFATVTAPIMKATRFVTPRFIVDQHIAFVAFFLMVARAGRPAGRRRRFRRSPASADGHTWTWRCAGRSIRRTRPGSSPRSAARTRSTTSC